MNLLNRIFALFEHDNAKDKEVILNLEQYIKNSEDRIAEEHKKIKLYSEELARYKK